jgi:hypothetical protein
MEKDKSASANLITKCDGVLSLGEIPSPLLPLRADTKPELNQQFDIWVTPDSCCLYLTASNRCAEVIRPATARSEE